MKAICKVSIGCIALAMTLQQSAFAENHLVVMAISNASALLGQTPAADEAVRRREADRWLREARNALVEGKHDAAAYYVDRAEKLNAKYESNPSRFTDTPAKVRRDISIARGGNAGQSQTPSQRFVPALTGTQRDTNVGAAATGTATHDQLLNQLTNSKKAQATDYLSRGRQALQQGDQQAALSWYQRAVATGASFTQSEFSPLQFAGELKRAGVDVGQMAQLQPTSPFPTKPSDFAPRELDRLPPIKPMPSTADSAFERGLVTNPTQLGTNGNVASASPQKSTALRLVAQAKAALGRGDLQSAQYFAQQAQSINVPDREFGQGETRPWELLLQIRSEHERRGSSQVIPAGNYEMAPAVANGMPGRSPVSSGVYSPESDQTRNRYAQAEVPTPATRPAEESSGVQIYREGLRALEAQDRDTALRLFRDAWQYESEFDPATRQQLKDKLSLLSAAGNRPLREPSPLEEVTAQQDLLRQQLFREITNESRESQEMVRTDPRGALQRIRQLRDRVSQAEIEPGARRQLLTIVDQELSGIESYVRQNEGDIALKERNREVIDSIDRERAQKIEVQQKVADLVEQFNDLLDEERYPEAEVISRQIRELDPESPITRLVTTKSKIARRMQRNQIIADQKEDGIVRALQDVDDASRMNVGDNPIDFGDTKRWEELSLGRLQRLEMQQRQLSPVEMEIQNTLKTPVNVNFNNRPLKEVLDTLATISGVNIYADPQGLAAEGVTSDTPVNITLTKDISLRSALNLILEPLRLSYVIQNEVLRITSEQLRDSNVHNKVYNVADLVIPIPNFVPGYNVGLPSAIREAHNSVGYGGAAQGVSMAPLTMASNDLRGSGAPNASALAQMSSMGGLSQGSPTAVQPLGYGGGNLGGAALADFDTLINLITSTISPDTWDEVGGPGAIEEFPTNLSLVISQTQDVHEQIADLLEQLRRLQDLQVTIEVRFITLNDDFFERIGVDFDFDVDDNVTTLPLDDSGPSVAIGLDPTTGTPTADFDFSFNQGSFGATAPNFGGYGTGATAANFGFAILSDIEAFFLIEAATGSTRNNLLSAPKVTLFNGQQASVSDVSQRPFVTSLIPVVGDFAAAHQPVIVVLSEGTSLGVQAVVSSDRRFVRLTLVPVFSQIGEVEEFTFDGATTTNTGSNVVDANGDPTGDTDNAVTTTAGTTVQLPTFSFTTVSTTVSVPDGGTVLLGGIKRLQEERLEEGVPMLNKLPYVNRLFKNVGIGRTTQSLMLMVTPRIIIQEEEEEKLGIEITP